MAVAKENRMMKQVSLVTLTVQNAMLGLCTRYARTRPGDMFFSTSAVLFGELVKLVAALLLVFKDERGSWRRLLGRLHQHMWREWHDTLRVGVPSLIYTLQNNLLYVAASNLDVATYQVTYQLKILTTALFSVLFLRRSLLRSQWLSLVVLVLGVALVQTSQAPPPTSASSASTGAASAPPQSRLTGVAAAVSACVLSGAAGVYFEWVLKGGGGGEVSVWMRNVQMSALSIPLAAGTALLSDGGAISRHGLLYGFDWFVWLVVVQNALGGLLVAVVVKYADNILKGFATSLAILLSAAASVYLFAFVVTAQFCLGTALVIGAVFLYGHRPAGPAAATCKSTQSGGGSSSALLAVKSHQHSPGKV